MKVKWENEEISSTMQLPSGFRLVVHRHINHPSDMWLMSLHPLRALPRELESKKLSEAKKEALALTRAMFKDVLDALETP